MPRSRGRRLLASLALFAIASVQASPVAADTPGPLTPDQLKPLGRILILDATSPENSLSTKANRVFCVPADARIPKPPAPKAKGQHLEESGPLDSMLVTTVLAMACDTTSPRTPDECLKALKKLSAVSSNRWVSIKGDKLGIFVFGDPGTKTAIDIEEDERFTRLSSDLATLARLAANGIFRTTGREPKRLSVSGYLWELQRMRSNLTVTAQAHHDGAKKADDTEGPKVTSVLVTGPNEHWFLSVNIPMTTLNGIALNDSGVGVPSEKPSQFLIGINYMMGDLLSRNSPAWWSGLSVGGVVAASSHPLESLGLTLGYRFAATKAYGFELDTFSPFVGWEQTISESKGSDGSVDKKKVYKFVAGLSFNLDAALAWFGSSKSKT